MGKKQRVERSEYMQRARAFMTAAYAGGYGPDTQDIRISEAMATVSILEEIVDDTKEDDALLVAGMFQKLLSDTWVQPKHIRKFFGSRVVKLVEDITWTEDESLKKYLDKLTDTIGQAQTIKLAGCYVGVNTLIVNDLLRTTSQQEVLKQYRAMIKRLDKGNESLYNITIDKIDSELDRLGI